MQELSSAPADETLPVQSQEMDPEAQKLMLALMHKQMMKATRGSRPMHVNSRASHEQPKKKRKMAKASRRINRKK